jgi:hypothetical protein
MFGLDFPRASMWFMPSPGPLLRELLEAAIGGVDAWDLDHAEFPAPATSPHRATDQVRAGTTLRQE